MPKIAAVVLAVVVSCLPVLAAAPRDAVFFEFLVGTVGGYAGAAVGAIALSWAFSTGATGWDALARTILGAFLGFAGGTIVGSSLGGDRRRLLDGRGREYGTHVSRRSGGHGSHVRDWNRASDPGGDPPPRPARCRCGRHRGVQRRRPRAKVAATRGLGSHPWPLRRGEPALGTGRRHRSRYEAPRAGHTEPSSPLSEAASPTTRGGSSPVHRSGSPGQAWSTLESRSLPCRANHSVPAAPNPNAVSRFTSGRMDHRTAPPKAATDTITSRTR